MADFLSKRVAVVIYKNWEQIMEELVGVTL